MTGQTTWDLKFPFKRPPLTENQRLHWSPKADLVKQVRASAWYAARSARIPALDRCTVTLTWFVRTNHRRDDDNVAPTLKAMCDGLVDAGVSKDDTSEFMVKQMPRIVRIDVGEPHMVLRIEKSE